jgi:magnesium transporter
MDSTALLDHREQLSMRPRRSSTANFASTAYDLSRALWRGRRDGRASHDGAGEDEGHDSSEDDTAPLVKLGERTSLLGGRHRMAKPSTAEAGSRGARLQPFHPSTPGVLEYGSVNCPPSIPTSPNLKPLDPTRGGLSDYDMSVRRNGGDTDTIIDIEPEIRSDQSRPSSSSRSSAFDNCPSLRTATNLAEEDVCFPVDDGLLDEEDEAAALNGSHYLTERSGRRRREWPDMTVLEEWSREEKEERSEGIRAKKLPEPVYVGGRLRPPIGPPWHKNEDESPYRFTYFNEDLPATIHSHTISELLQPGQSFNDLFRPEPRVLDDSSGDDTPQPTSKSRRTESRASDGYESRNDLTPPEPSQSLPKLGSRPTFWLDVLKPTEAEMRIISKAFGIHPLTTEDIMMQETREKVELFRSYYLVSYRTFEQDSNSEDFMQPVNIYVVVFRDGVISVR